MLGSDEVFLDTLSHISTHPRTHILAGYNNERQINTVMELSSGGVRRWCGRAGRKKRLLLGSVIPTSLDFWEEGALALHGVWITFFSRRKDKFN